MDKFLTVSQLNNYIRGVFEDELILQEINVMGEILEFKISSGNTYILLKEGGCVLNCVYFSAIPQYQIGQKVCLSGSVRFYHKSGKVSFIVTNIKVIGRGELLAALELTKEKLKNEGVFSNSRSLPCIVARVALITSAEGAVIHDFIEVSRPLAYLNIKVFSSKVQGEGASEEIIGTLSDINNGKFGIFDVIVIARGGGSAIDLSEFNSEKLARQIHKSIIPVISAVGHEVDYTLSDYAADIRAGTPTMAAEIILNNNRRFFDRLLGAADIIQGRIERLLEEKLKSLSVLSDKISNLIIRRNRKKFNAAIYGVLRIHQRLEALTEKAYNKNKALNRDIYAALNGRLTLYQNRLNVLSAASQELNPQKILAKGYAKIYKNQSEIIGVKQLSCGDDIEIMMSDGKIPAKIE